MYILEGQGVMVSDKNEHQVEPGNVLWVAPFEHHQIKNTGKDTLKFICCVPQKKP